MSSHSSRRPGSSRHSAGLMLRVTRPDGHADEFYLAGGLTIGRSVANTVVLADDDSVDRTHARVEVAADGGARLRCVEPDSSLTTGGGAVRELPLDEGVRFGIGRTGFECVSGRRVRDEGTDRAGASCPFYGSTGVPTEGQAARECPDCREQVLPVLFDPHDPFPVLVPLAYGGYRAERYVARGGMGMVLKGASEAGETVAVKVLLPGTALDRRDAGQFEQEVAMLARVRHPNVVKLLDHGESGRYNFLVMEWIEGPSLRSVIADANRADRLTDFATAFRWFGLVAKGLAAIHAVGMVHRDIKPSNILIGPDGVARIADLGIAKRVDAELTSYTTTGHAPGTYEYMAPEQINAPDTVDGRADLYALGVTFYELLSGMRPLGAWHPASEVNPTVPGPFDAILGRLLAPRPEHRFGDIYELLSAAATMGPNPSAPIPAVTVAADKGAPTRTSPSPPAVPPRPAEWQSIGPQGGAPHPVKEVANVLRAAWARFRDWYERAGDPSGARSCDPEDLTFLGRAAGRARRAAIRGAVWGAGIGLAFGAAGMFAAFTDPVGVPLSLAFVLSSLKVLIGFATGGVLVVAFFGLVLGALGFEGGRQVTKGPANPLTRRPWTPWLIGLCVVSFGPIWVGVMAALNWRRLDTSRNAWRPIAIDPAAFFLSFYGFSYFLEVSQLGVAFSLAFSFAITFFVLLSTDLIAQQRIFNARRASGGSSGSWMIPLIMGGVQWALLSVMYDESSLAPSYHKIGVEAASRGEYSEAIAAFSASIHADPNFTASFNDRGFVYSSMRDYDRAIADYDEAIRLDPNNAVAYSNRGSAYDNKGEHDRAITDFDVAIRLDPKLAVAYSNRGLAYWYKKDYDRTIVDCDEAIRLDPNNAGAYGIRGLAYNIKGEHDRAIANYDEAIKLDPKLAVSYDKRGLAYDDKGEHDRAIADYDVAIRLDPGNPVTLANRGLARQAKGDLDAAVADYQSALRLNPPDPKGYRELLEAAESAKRQSGR